MANLVLNNDSATERLVYQDSNQQEFSLDPKHSRGIPIQPYIITALDLFTITLNSSDEDPSASTVTINEQILPVGSRFVLPEGLYSVEVE